MSPVGIGGLAPLQPGAIPAGKAAEPGFAAAFEGAIERVDTLAVHGDEALAKLARGDETDLHGAMIALQEADIAVRAMVTVRDKLVLAYEHLMNMSI